MIPQLTVLLAALLFGASAPFAKLMLAELEPLQLAGLLYAGSGCGLLVIRLIRNGVLKRYSTGRGIDRSEIKWLAGSVICGGIAAPIALMIGLEKTPAATTSLLLNFEAVATSAIAVLIFGEHAGRTVWTAIVLIAFGGLMLTLDTSGAWSLSPGVPAIILACILWGFDNNFMRAISFRDPFFIVIVKDLISGAFSLALSCLLGYTLPGVKIIVYASFVGFVSYGLSLVFFIISLRDLGSSRTAALFGLAPFMGAAISILVFRESENLQFYVSLPFMIAGAWLLFHEKLPELHRHETIARTHASTITHPVNNGTRGSRKNEHSP